MGDSSDIVIDWDESGSGPTLLFVPGSFSNAAAWRPVRARLDDRYRTVATSLPGYGGTAELRRDDDPSPEPYHLFFETLMARAGGPVHLVAFSFGGLAALAACLAGRIAPTSLTLIDAIPLDLLRQSGHGRDLDAVVAVTRAYVRAARAGEPDAARLIIDMWSGAGTYDSLGEKARRIIREATPAMLRDSAAAERFRASLAGCRRLALPTHVICGTGGHPAMLRMAEVVAAEVPSARLSAVAGASHQLIFTHADEVAGLIDRFVREAEG